MRALRFHGPKDLRVDDIPEPTCLPHQIKIQPAFCGICGTDLHEYSSPTFVPAKDRPHPVTKEVMPVGVGHEFSGTVVEISADVDVNINKATASSPSLAVGDYVAVQPTICCWRCPPCDEGIINCCDNAGFIGLSGGGGGMSDFVCVDQRFVFRLPDGVPLEVGALVEPLAVAWHAVDETKIQAGDNALVLGAGPIGLSVIQCLKARGAKQILVAEVSTERQRFASRFGATTIIDPRTEDVVKRAKELCGNGTGPEIALDCAGVPASIRSAVLSVKARGIVVNVAIWEKEVPFNPNTLVFGEKKYAAVLGYTQKDYKGVIAAISNKSIVPDAMVTSKVTIDRVVEDGFRALIEEKDRHVKILVDSRA